MDDDKEIVHGGKFIKGYTLEECSEMKGNDINRIVTWNGSADLSKLRGKAVCLRFFIKNAGIYTFKVYDK